MKALVVDDSRAIRLVLRATLADFGFEVVEADDGREALARIEEQGLPDLVCIDWNMPNMNGLELVQALQTRTDLGNTKLVMVTSEAEIVHVTMALEAGADEYIMKPFQREDLAVKLQMLGFAA